MLKRFREIWNRGKAYGLAFMATGAVALANNTTNDPINNFSRAACKVAEQLSSTTLVFGAMLLIVLWVGYAIYMGKRDATEVLVRGLIASAIVLGAKTVATWFIAGGSC